MCEAIVVLVTCAGADEAQAIADAVVAERLAACANVAGSVRSLFHWKGALSRETETLLLLKTRLELFERLRRRVRELHSYEVPEIIALPIIAGDADYLAWIRESTVEAG